MKWSIFSRAQSHGHRQDKVQEPASRADAPDSQYRSPNRFFYQFQGATAAALVLVAIVCVVFFRYSIPVPGFDEWAGYVSVGIAIAYSSWAGFHRFVEAGWMIFWSRLLAELLVFPMYLGARSKLPLADHALARIDRSMGIEVPVILHLVAPHPWVAAFFRFSYDLLLPIIVVGVVLPSIRYQWRAIKELLIGTTFCTILGSALFALVPAIGPWAVYGYAPSPVQASCEHLFLTLRSGVPYLLNDNDTGIICFPSFHVALAVISCVALWSIKPARIPAILVTIAIVFSTLVIGWHYVADVLGGLALAFLSILAGRWYTRIETRVARLRENAA